MKTIKLFLLLSVALYGSSNGQPLPKLNFESILNTAPYVFEGEIIDTMYYNGATGRRDDLFIEINSENKIVRSCKPLTSHKIQITKIFRGNLKSGTIDLVVNGGLFWGNGLRILDACDECFQPMPIGTKGIFFCNKFPTWRWKFSPMVTDNEIRVIPIELIFYSQGGGRMEGFDKVFHSQKEINDFLSKYPNITIPKDTTNEK